MPELFSSNVHDMLPKARTLLAEDGEWNHRRNGVILELDGAPAVMIYLRPNERVLFYPERDANPFFHLFESLWMLAGRRDVRWLEQWSSQIAQYSDDGKIFNGAYGYRWRMGHGADQIKNLISLLRNEPHTRRAVLQMWSPEHDLHTTDRKTKDACCNLSCAFSIGADKRLNMAVFNRSNDLILGCCGANAVHFSVLLEYVASALKIPVGRYMQISSNLHAYKEQWEKFFKYDLSQPNPYDNREVVAYPLVHIQEEWNWELIKFIEATGPKMELVFPQFHELFFRDIAAPMATAHRIWKNKENSNRFEQAKAALEDMPWDCDWRKASWEWIDRREQRAK